MTEPAKTPGSTFGELIPQPHGGALRRGNHNGGAGGRRPDSIKRLAKKALAPRIKLLGHFADGVAVQQVDDAKGNRTFALQSPTPGERIRAIEALHKIAGDDGKTIKAGAVRRRLEAQLNVIDSRPTWDSEELKARLREIW